MIAHSEYVWQIYCASIDIECQLLLETTLTPIAAKRRKKIYIFYALILLVICPLACANFVTYASGNLDLAFKLYGYIMLIFGLWTVP